MRREKSFGNEEARAVDVESCCPVRGTFFSLRSLILIHSLAVSAHGVRTWIGGGGCRAESMYVSNAAMSRPVVFTRSSPPPVLMWIIDLETIGCHWTFAGFIDIAVDFICSVSGVFARDAIHQSRREDSIFAVLFQTVQIA